VLSRSAFYPCFFGCFFGSSVSRLRRRRVLWDSFLCFQPRYDYCGWLFKVACVSVCNDPCVFSDVQKRCCASTTWPSGLLLVNLRVLLLSRRKSGAGASTQRASIGSDVPTSPKYGSVCDRLSSAGASAKLNWEGSRLECRLWYGETFMMFRRIMMVAVVLVSC
jgi:hypothetical protein